MNDRVDVLHGVNFDMLGRRDAAHYGGLTLPELEVRIQGHARELGLEVSFYQSNHEGEYCEFLHRAGERADGLLLNPGAWTHYGRPGIARRARTVTPSRIARTSSSRRSAVRRTGGSSTVIT